MKMNSDVLPVLESLNEGREKGEDLGIQQLDSDVSHGTRGSLVVLLREAADFYINNRTKPTALHNTSFYQFNEELLQMFYELFDAFNTLAKLSFLGLLNEKSNKAPEEER